MFTLPSYYYIKRNISTTCVHLWIVRIYTLKYTFNVKHAEKKSAGEKIETFYLFL